MKNVIPYIKENGLAALSENFAIKITPHKDYPNLVGLCYHLTKTPINAITNECRGMVIDKETFEVVAYPFDRFFDYVPNTDNNGFDFSNFIAAEKIDGTMIVMYWYADKWNIGTKGTPDASGLIPDKDKTYSEYFWEIWHKLGYDIKRCSKVYTHIFEFKFRSKKQFYTKTVQPTITYIGCRDALGFERYVNDTTQRRAKVYTNKDCIETLQNATNPIYTEGFVLIDSNFNRLKIKNPVYELMTKLGRAHENDTEITIEQKTYRNNAILSEISYYYSNIDLGIHLGNIGIIFGHSLFREILQNKRALLNEICRIKKQIGSEGELSNAELAKFKDSTFLVT